MKTILATLSLALVCILAHGQSRFLLGNQATYQGFGGPFVELSMFKSSPMLSFGGGGGIILSKRLFIGGYGSDNFMQTTGDIYPNQLTKLEFGHGGLWMGYLHHADSVIHFGASVKMGWGGYKVSDAQSVLLESNGLYVICPQAEVELNLLPFMKLPVAAGYRYAFASSPGMFSGNSFSSPFATAGLLFGWFAD